MIMRPSPLFIALDLHKNKHFFTYGILCFSLVLSACQKPVEQVEVATQHPIELIAADLVAVKTGTAIERANFTGTIRAIHQSSIQAQVSATATQVYVQVGQRVNAGQRLVQLNNQDNAARLAQARANLASTQAQANQAQRMMQRKKRLLDQGFISKVEYEQSQVDYQAEVENIRAQQANVDIALKADQDGLILSPISGVITQRQVEPGQTVSIGQTLFEIVDPDHLEIQAKISNDQQGFLNIGQAIEYQVQGEKNTLHAKVSRISPVADQSSRQIEFFAEPQEKINALSIGAFVDGKLISAQQTNGQIIPLNTIQNLDTQAYVWAIRQGKINKVNIEILQNNYSENQAVVRGLAPQDQVSRVNFKEDDINQAVIIQKP
jgi:RND family efflux transporter MFP subunit